MNKSNKTLALALVAITLAIGGTVVALSALGVLPFSILPGFEGLNVGVYGFSPGTGNAATSTAGSLPTLYSWVSRDPQNAQVRFNNNITSGEVGVRVSVASHDDPIRTVTYYVKTGENSTTTTYRKIVGYLVPYYVNVNVFSAPAKGLELFEGEQFWFIAQTVVWDSAMHDPDNPSLTSNAAYSVPLAVFIDDYYIAGYVDSNGNAITPGVSLTMYAQTQPAYEGSYLTLYSTPSDVATLSDLYKNPQALAQSLQDAKDIQPDSRMQSQVYFPMTLTKFGGHAEGFWITYKEFYPSVAYKLKVYYLQLGEFTLTVDKAINQTLPNWTVPNSTATPNWWDTTWGSFADWAVKAWNGWWANPVNWIALFVMVALITTIIVVIFLIYSGIIRLRRGVGK